MTDRTLKRVDWFRVFTDLDRRGFSLPEVGRTLGVSKKTLYSVRDGCSPSYETGVEIVGIWTLVTGKTVAEVPREHSLSAAKV